MVLFFCTFYVFSSAILSGFIKSTSQFHVHDRIIGKFLQQALPQGIQIFIHILCTFQPPGRCPCHRFDGEIFSGAHLDDRLHYRFLRLGDGLATLAGFLCKTLLFRFCLCKCLLCQAVVLVYHLVQQTDLQCIGLILIAAQHRHIVAVHSTVQQLLEPLHVATVLCVLVGLVVQHLQHTVAVVLNGFYHRCRLLLQNLVVPGHELFPQLRQLGDLTVGCFHAHDAAHLPDNILQCGVHDIGLAVIVNAQHIQCTAEDLLLLAVGAEEFLHRLKILAKIQQLILPVADFLEKFQRSVDLGKFKRKSRKRWSGAKNIWLSLT